MNNYNRVVLDTSAILFDPEILFSNDYKTILIPYEVIQELDRIKSKSDFLGAKARKAIRILYNNFNNKIEFLNPISLLLNDDSIIEAARQSDALLLTNDFNIVLKCRGLNVKAEILDSQMTNEFSASGELFTGIQDVLVDDNVIDELYAEDSEYIDNIEFEDYVIHMNQFVRLTSLVNPKKKIFLMKKGEALFKVIDLSRSVQVWGLEPRNLEQRLALELLMDPDIHLVSLIGLAGSGKSLMATAAGLQQIFTRKLSNGEQAKRFKKMIISRPIQVMGADIGYLPGSMEEKLAPWIAPIMDCLDFLEEGNKLKISKWFEDGKIQVEAPTYIRGRSIPDSFIIIDECQNLSMHEIKTILTRAGENSKIVLTGDVEQIDNSKLNKYTNGLTYAIERLKGYDISGHLTLQKSERSRLAEICAKEL